MAPRNADVEVYWQEGLSASKGLLTSVCTNGRRPSARQKILERKRPLRLWILLDEAALYRPIGGPKVMPAQLERIVEAAQLPTVTIQVLPFAQGAHSATAGDSASRWPTSATP